MSTGLLKDLIARFVRDELMPLDGVVLEREAFRVLMGSDVVGL
jgi:hypothetical protein